MKPNQKVLEVRFIEPIQVVGEVHSFLSREKHGMDLSLTEIGIFIHGKSRAGTLVALFIPYANVSYARMDPADVAVRADEPQPRKAS